MKQEKFKIYSESELPVGFRYPVSYLKLSEDLKKISSIAYFPWWFSDAEDSLKYNMEIYYNLTGYKYLIEFARDGDWAACFDAMDKSGNPRVLVYDLGNKKNHYEKKSFDDWLSFVIEEIG